MLKFVSVLVVGLFLLVGCGGDDGGSASPTVGATTPDTAQSAPPADGVGDLTLGQTVESATGVTYQLPAGWTLQDNESVSNFASDANAVLDSMSGDEERTSRWMMLGSVGRSTPERIMALGDASNFEEAADALHGYFYTSEYSLTPPNIITLDNGKQATFSIGVNENREGWAVAVYFVDAGDGTYINLFFEARQENLLENTAFIREVVESAVLR